LSGAFGLKKHRPPYLKYARKKANSKRKIKKIISHIEVNRNGCLAAGIYRIHFP